jgi:hypothetical protein
VEIPPVTGATEEYDGSTWTTSPGRFKYSKIGLAGCGTQTAALAFGGTPPVTGATEEYNGQLGLQILEVKYSKREFRWSRYTNSCFSFWW